MTKWLFLHYGPGGNSAIERSLFGNCEMVEFWDQPSCVTKSELLAATKEKIAHSFSNSRELKIIGHSYGCDLLLESLTQEQASRTTAILISPVPNIYLGIVNLAKTLSRQTHSDSGVADNIKLAIAFFESTSAPAEFWGLFQAIIKSEHFASVYWKSMDSFNTFQRYQDQAPAFRSDEWVSILSETFNLNTISSQLNFKKIMLLQGAFDPYLDGSEVKLWKKSWNNLELTILETGHYPHIEKPEALKNILNGRNFIKHHPEAIQTQSNA